MVTVADLLTTLEALAPLSTAAEWDNVGLLLGDRAAPVERVMTCLTVTPESVAEAIQERVQLIVSHHPVLFRAVKKLTTQTPEGRMLLNLVQAGVAVYSAHTAYDNADSGINQRLAQRLGLTNIAPLRVAKAEAACKIVVFVPDADLAKVSDTMFAAGAGRIGQYRECSFRLAGTGTFFGSDASNPTVGVKGRREEVAEWRLEVLCPEAVAERVIAVMRQAHSYEEPAYDVYPLQPGRGQGGEGRHGTLPAPVKLADFARAVKQALNANGVQVVGSPERMIQRVAIACGAAGDFLSDARQAGAEVFLTGEVRFHDCLAAEAHHLALVLPGHYATERPGVEALADDLQRHFPSLTVWASRQERDPLRTL
jgi:dinuclear metal center YbgI/SA1388 family protein